MNPLNCFEILNEEQFNECALDTFRFQSENIEVYRDFLQALNFNPSSVEDWTKIPFLPVEFFKSHRIIPGNYKPEIIFSSSGTTGSITSKHFVYSEEMYRKSFRNAFELFYGKPEYLVILALLPSYEEREGSSLIYMVNDLIVSSNDERSGFYGNDPGRLFKVLQELKAENRKVLLIGVSFALLDFSEKYSIDFPQLIVMETGGMKGRRKEIIREDLHQKIKQCFSVQQVHSEYGMTELLSQAYSSSDGKFKTPPWMKIRIREMNDPFTYCKAGLTGGVNIIDLANYYTCSFIATQDLGKSFDDGTFEVLGRFDNSDLRGCNLLI